MNSYNAGGFLATLIKGIGLLIKKILWLIVAITCGGATLYQIGVYAVLIGRPTIYMAWFIFFGLINMLIAIGAIRKIAGKTFFPRFHKKNYREIDCRRSRKSLRGSNRNYIGSTETYRIGKNDTVNILDQFRAR